MADAVIDDLKQELMELCVYGDVGVIENIVAFVNDGDKWQC